MPFMSAWGCCAVCRRVVSCRAPDFKAAVGSKPYSHKAVAGGDKPWCEGVHEPALHFTRSTDLKAVEEIKMVLWQSFVCGVRRKEKQNGK